MGGGVIEKNFSGKECKSRCIAVSLKIAKSVLSEIQKIYEEEVNNANAADVRTSCG